MVYSADWKKFELTWDLVIRLRRVGQMQPLLEQILEGFKPPKRGSELQGSKTQQPAQIRSEIKPSFAGGTMTAHRRTMQCEINDASTPTCMAVSEAYISTIADDHGRPSVAGNRLTIS
jgi:hypothetical protein